MAKFSLNIGESIKESLLFWLTKYLIYKATTLDNSKANKTLLQLALKSTKPTPESFEELIIVAREIQKAGVGIYTLFYPAWLFCKENVDNLDFLKMEDIDEESIIQWLSIATSSKSASTKRNYKVALQDFFNYLSRYNANKYHFDIDLSKWQKNLKNAIDKPPAFLTEKELYLFLDNLNNFYIKKPPKGENIDEESTALYRFLFKLTILSGLRISEVIKLKLKDFEIDEKDDVVYLHVLYSKANKSRIVPIPYSQGKYNIKQEYEEYIKIRQCDEECKEYLFCNKKKRCLSKKTVDNNIKKYLMQLGLKKEKTGMHLLRHSHASFFHKKVKDPVVLQERLGHSDPKTTKKYIHLEDEVIKKSADIFR